MFPYLLSFLYYSNESDERKIPKDRSGRIKVSFFLDLPRGWYPTAQSQHFSPDAEIEACAENEPFLLIEEERFDAPSMARE